MFSVEPVKRLQPNRLDAHRPAIKQRNGHIEILTVCRLLLFQDSDRDLFAHAKRFDVIGEIVDARPVASYGDIRCELV